MNPFFFPDWTNRVRLPAGMLLAAAPLYLLGVVYYGGSPKTTDVGYAPKQPIPYSHALHVGQLGMDCKFCHTTVDKAAFAAIPPAETCIGCHGQTIKAKSPKLTPLREAYTSVENKPVEWIKVHDLPDYVYFNHSSHVNRGVGCASCHGRIDNMEVVKQENTLSMGWCLNCHRNPENHLRPQSEVTNLNWTPNEDQRKLGLAIKAERGINPPTHCSTCHR
jgi:hypothetical protein